VAFIAGPDVLVAERLDARPLLEVAPAGTIGTDVAARLLADLHGSGVVPSRRRTTGKLVRSVQRKAAEAGALVPGLATAFEDAAEQIGRARPADGELVPGHGDFSPRNVLVGPATAALIDFDRLQLADPARDVAYFAAWCWAWGVSQSGDGDWIALDRMVAAYPAGISARLPFYVAAGLVRIAHSLVTLWPDDVPHVPRLLEEARRCLP